VNSAIPTKGAGVMWWFPHPMAVWDYVIMVINMVLFWGLIVGDVLLSM
jgi:hypothetical protein